MLTDLGQPLVTIRKSLAKAGNQASENTPEDQKVGFCQTFAFFSDFGQRASMQNLTAASRKEPHSDTLDMPFLFQKGESPI